MGFAGVLLLGCSALDLEETEPPPIPEDFPQLGRTGGGAVELVVDGERYDDGATCSHGVSLEGSSVRFELSVALLEISVTGRGLREYSSEWDEVEAEWGVSPEAFATGPDCGVSRVDFAGASTYEDAFGEAEATWGTVQLVLCNASGERREVSGKFSCTL
ncbi:MAG: hypothetical protein AAGA54_28410 [Myxococcota bacterium]